MKKSAVSGNLVNFFRQSLAPLVALLFAVGVFVTAPALHAQASAKQETFSSPQDALKALVSAAEAKDRSALGQIFGPEYDRLLSGDPVQDAKHLDHFSKGVRESATLQRTNESKYTVTIGKRNWPFPVPIVEQNGRWHFDTAAGLDEILDRRIGRNELTAISVCRAYVVAQWEYFTDGDWGHDGVNAYAPKFISTPGTHDGLYWETAEGETPSPLGELVARARAEGYGRRGAANHRSAAGAQRPHSPYHGYYFKILTRQGAYAPGGKYDYIINGNMIAGFALVAYPDKWGNSGVMTFIVNQQGRVYEKNLGAETAKLAGEITEYNPDPSWKLVNWHLEASE